MGDRASRGWRRRSPALVIAIAVASLALPAAAPGAGRPKLSGLRCVDSCAGIRAGAVGATIRFSGRHLGHVGEVRFSGDSGPLTVPAEAVARRRLKAKVPAGARTGRPSVAEPGGASDRARKRLRVVPQDDLPRGFSLQEARTRPREAFFDERDPIHLRYRFRSERRRSLRVRLVRRGSGAVVRSWTERDVLPYSRHSLTWSGLTGGGRPAPEGRYKFRIGTLGGADEGGGKFRLHGFFFPVRGPHGYGGSLQRFGAPRSGGRVHEGQDVFSPCGTSLKALRGGHVQARGSDPQLHGNWLVIDGTGTSTDYRYSHLRHPTPRHAGERVHTAQGIGRVGRTGNARTVGCMLHLEIWPSGWQRGRPVDPLPQLRRWDGWS